MSIKIRKSDCPGHTCFPGIADRDGCHVLILPNDPVILAPPRIKRRPLHIAQQGVDVRSRIVLSGAAADEHAPSIERDLQMSRVAPRIQERDQVLPFNRQPGVVQLVLHGSRHFQPVWTIQILLYLV